ncbi:twin-arginine translocation signal domain-containing protein [Pelomicrobium methylotrophicum]|uniref:Twin-arginine translocation signal domain-containing protein n=1 Tax=Pelomicrobium methylotrophicum TaxID=2602750 RepID=A0A5C7EJ68_9PROT|nr:twin-arginine translocation signal domain-containing protein [Pelomicrobium methylotrophicum]TXF12465.1 twin-arginine translocation signal domain-containing protein [Pelomicrobium methylotrophicum]
MSATTNAGRRKFMMALTAGGAAAAAAALTGTPNAPLKAKAEKVAAVEKKGYQETAHVREYYRTARV